LDDIPIHPDLELYDGEFRVEFAEANSQPLWLGGLDRAREAGLSAKDLILRDREVGVYRYVPPPRPTRDPATPASSGWGDFDPESAYLPLDWWSIVDFYNTQLSEEDGRWQGAIDIQQTAFSRISGTLCNSHSAAWTNSDFENQLLVVSVVSGCSILLEAPAELRRLVNRGSLIFTVAIYTFEPE
jgi:hypothetical protein